MRLNVGMFRTKKIFGTLDCQAFRNIDKFATTIVPAPWIAFGIFIRQHRTGGLHNGPTNKIFRSDELDRLILPPTLRLYRLKHFWIYTTQRNLQRPRLPSDKPTFSTQYSTRESLETTTLNPKLHPQRFQMKNSGLALPRAHRLRRSLWEATGGQTA